MKNWKALRETVHATAVDRGFWEKPPSTEEIICDIHGSITDAWREFKKHGLDPKKFMCSNWDGSLEPLPPLDEYIELLSTYHEYLKPEGIAVELADVVIRLMDWCEAVGVSLKWLSGATAGDTTFEREIIRLHGRANSLIYSKPTMRRQYMLDDIIMAANAFSIPLERAIRVKIEFNKTRPYKHGKRC